MSLGLGGHPYPKSWALAQKEVSRDQHLGYFGGPGMVWAPEKQEIKPSRMCLGEQPPQGSIRQREALTHNNNQDMLQETS